MLTNDLGRCGAADVNRPTALYLARERGFAMEKRNFVLFKQIQNTIVVLLHNAILATKQLFKIQADAFHFNAVLCKMMIHLIVVL